MYDQILNRLSQFVSFDRGEQDFFVSKLIVKNYNKKELILQEGNICKYAYFINSGCLRYFYNIDGQENTAQFFFENGWYTDYDSFLTGRPTQQNIETLEKTELLLLSSKDGLPYQSKIWARDFPVLMQNVINACEKANAKLIFLDNVYMYAAPLSLPFDEQEPQNPTSKKGVARKQTADLLLKAMADKKIKAVIGRSADFYGEFTTNSALYNSFLQNMLKGKAPQVLGKKDITHTYAYSGDNGRALVALALDDSTYGQVWHLPVSKPITFDEMNNIMNSVLSTTFTISYVSKTMRKILSLFIPPIKEVEEMLFQFENPYEMNFDKFKRKFPNFQVTSYQNGIKNMIQSFRKA